MREGAIRVFNHLGRHGGRQALSFPSSFHLALKSDWDGRRRHRSRSRSRERGKRHRSRSLERRRDRDRDRDRDRERFRDRERHDGHTERYPSDTYGYRLDRDGRRYSSRAKSPELTPEERDARTVFVWQLSARIRQRDLEDFFSSVGKIRDVRLIMDNKTRRSKGIAYVEFREVESAQLALGLTGTRLLGVPIQIQQSHAEKNRLGNLVNSQVYAASTTYHRPPQPKGPMKLYVGSLHFNITEEMLKGIFEPFGKLEELKLIKDTTTGRSQGYGFVTYTNSDDAKKALEQLNGFELAGRPMKVNYVTEKSDLHSLSLLDNEDADRAGIELGTTGRLALMAKLAEGTGLELPKSALVQIQAAQGNPTLGAAGAVSSASATAPPVCTQCFMLSNMFDPHIATLSTFEEIRDDVIEECSKFGGVLHMYVDRTSAQGNVYVKCPSIGAATNCVNALHGRYFSGRLPPTASFLKLAHLDCSSRIASTSRLVGYSRFYREQRISELTHDSAAFLIPNTLLLSFSAFWVCLNLPDHIPVNIKKLSVFHRVLLFDYMLPTRAPSGIPSSCLALEFTSLFICYRFNYFSPKLWLPVACVLLDSPQPFVALVT
ncbi:unnamed protein product [Protopolystoma xenopodis]|uniref:RRM domain-containing protein n=1 Tax=Protopolystoma xenopodis TaxID=117903 RepID=A0A448XH76_9PLAT|nr:unnamed protein product [Protopolystoma xenopodis]